MIEPSEFFEAIKHRASKTHPNSEIKFLGSGIDFELKTGKAIKVAGVSIGGRNFECSWNLEELTDLEAQFPTEQLKKEFRILFFKKVSETLIETK